MKENRIRLSTFKQQWTMNIMIVSIIGLFVLSVASLNLEVSKFINRFEDAGAVLKNFLVLDFSDFSEIIQELIVSISMAISSLAVGTVLSLLLAFLGANTIAPNKGLATLIKAFISIVRAVPALVWILVIVASLGFGHTAGVVGMIFPTTGYLTKSFISSIEEQDEAIIETMKATGASWFQLITEGLIPNLVNPFLSWISIRLESNIAESISLGMVGAGGIGAVLMKAIGGYEYGRISAVILCIFATMISVELFVTQLKKRLR